MSKRGKSRVDPRTRYYVLASCESCGDIAVAGEHTFLFRDASSGVVTVAFPCSRCGLRSSTVVGAAQLSRLIERGFPIVPWQPPAELLEPHPVADPFTVDDLLDAHEFLARTDFVVELLVSD